LKKFNCLKCRREKHKREGLNCVSFFFFLNQSSESDKVQILKQCSESNAADKIKIEREEKDTRNNTGSFHNPEVVLSPLALPRRVH